MAENVGLSFLQDYAVKTDPLFEKYLHQKIEQAQEISKIPGELLRRFLEMGRKGKKIRGALTVLGYQAVGGRDLEAIFDASLFLELFHAGVLVHDDIMDQDDLRRGLPTLHVQFAEVGTALHVHPNPSHYGYSMAVNAGDAAFYLSWEKLMQSHFDPDRLIDVGQIYADYVIRVVHGQVLDITDSSMGSITQEDVMKVRQYKTVEYTGVLPLLVGAAFAGPVSKPLHDAIQQYGNALGWAFQIQDDLLGIFGDTDTMGKPTGSDIREGKQTLLVLHVMEHGNKDQKAFLRHVLGNQSITPAEIDQTLELFKQTGAYDVVIKRGWDYVKQGADVIPHITSDAKIQEILNGLINYMMERVK
ncbi:polyprenyl synthetase family protein [candidate division WWE3 bacterium]|nr:polyprenyl synthetase family protein [candidate division WWE3 bacterium]